MKIGRHGVFTPDQARQEAAWLLREVALGKDPAGARMALRSAPTMEQLCDEYVSDMQSGKVNGKKTSTIKTDISRITTHIKPALGKRKVASVTQEDVERFMHGLNPGSARRVTGRYRGPSSPMRSNVGFVTQTLCMGWINQLTLNVCVEWLRASTRSYRARFKVRKKNVATDVFLFLAVSGWRSGEAKNLKFSEVDLERRVATLGDTKSGLSIPAFERRCHRDH